MSSMKWLVAGALFSFFLVFLIVLFMLKTFGKHAAVSWPTPNFALETTGCGASRVLMAFSRILQKCFFYFSGICSMFMLPSFFNSFSKRRHSRFAHDAKTVFDFVVINVTYVYNVTYIKNKKEDKKLLYKEKQF